MGLAYRLLPLAVLSLFALAIPGQELPAPLGKHAGVVSTVSFSPDSRVVASSGHEDKTVRLWERTTGKELLCYRGHSTWVMCAHVAPDGKTVASTALEETIRIWDAATGKDVRVINAAPHPFGVTFAPDGKRIATAGHDRTLRVWDVATGNQLFAVAGYGGRVWQVSFSPDGLRVASSCEDGVGFVHDATTGRELFQVRGGDENLTAIAFSPDGKLLATGGGAKTIWLWDARTGKPRGRLVGSQGAILRVAFSPDGRNLVSSAYQEAAVRLWEVATGAEVMQFAGHAPWPDAVAYAPDGRFVASGGRDAAVRVWDVAGKAAPAKAENLEALGRDLAGNDPARAHRAGWSLAAAPDLAVPFLKGTLKPVLPPADLARRLAKLVADLDSDDFDTREAASTELAKLGQAAENVLRAALEKTPSAEVRQRATALLDRLEGSLVPPEAVLAVRGVAVLERIRTPAARALLAELAAGPAADWLTREARATLVRLGDKLPPERTP